jgi:adenine deaminase
MLCTDDREAADILANGHLNRSLRQCVAEGVDPLLAVTLGTLNAAECYRLHNKGAIAPGRDADLAIVADLKDFEVTRVFTAGREVARNGQMLSAPQDIDSDKVRHTVYLSKVTEASFRLPLRCGTVRAIGLIPNSVLTKNLTLTVNRDPNGDFDPRLNPGLNKLAVIERHRASGRIGLGILEGYGLKNGALAVTVAHDSHNLVVAGDNDADMLAAVKDVKKIGGGFSLCGGGQVLANLPLPVAGLMSDRPAEEVAAALERLIETARRELGLPDSFNPLMKLVFLTLPVIPELKLTCNGLFDVSSFSLVDICKD